MVAPRPPSVLGFFFSSRRRRAKMGGGGRRREDPATQRLLEGVDGVLDSMDASENVAEYIREDLKDAFKIKAPLRPGYEPGRIAPTEVNLIDFVTDPIETTWKTIKKPFESTFASSLDVSAIFAEQLDRAVWDYLYKNAWVDAGRSVVPDSTRAAVSVWSQRTGLRSTRHLAAAAVRESPGMTAMKAGRLELHYSQPGPTYDAAAAAKFRNIQTKAEPFNKEISIAWSEGKRLKEEGDSFAEAGRIVGRGEAKDLWEGADDKYRECDDIQKDWKNKHTDLRKETDREFARLSARGGPLYNSPEAGYSRFFEARNLHYATLNLLRTYKKDGFWGVVKWYGWKQATNKFKDYYPPTLLNKALNKVASKLGAAKLLGKFANLQTLAKRFLSARNIVLNALKKGAKAIIIKLGLGELIGGILGTAIPIPVVGNAIGAAIGAVVQFVGDIVVGKVMGGLKEVLKILAYAVVGVAGCFVLFGIGIIVLISIILSNTSYPWEAVATELDCDTSATAVDSCFPKSLVQQKADTWGPAFQPGENAVEECYSDVVAKSNGAGVDPGIALATWLHESNASNYAYYQRIGEPPQDFGVPQLAGRGFTAQINRFFNLYNSYYPSAFASCYTGHSEMEGFFRAFCTAGRAEFGVGQCPNLTPAGDACVLEYLNTYALISTCP